MGQESKRVSRPDLYNQVWTVPMSRLAQEYRLSDVGLAKICKKHRIPRPPRGYWARIAAGEKLKRAPLPAGDPDAVIEITPNTANVPASRLEDNEASLILLEKSPENKILVPDRLVDAHPLVKQSAEILRSLEPGNLGLIDPPKRDCLDISVSKKSLTRALRIMDALIKALTKRGHEVALTKESTQVTVLGCNIRFGISEMLATVRKEPKNQLNGYYQFGHSRFEYDRAPSGQLCLTIHESTYPSKWQQSWKEQESKTLEERLNSFVAGLLKVSIQKREQERLEKERERERLELLRRQEEERKIRAERARRFKEEAARVSKLLKDAENWSKSSMIRQYLSAIESLVTVGECPFKPEEGLDAWLKWARDQADRLDPLRPSPPSILDEPDEEEEKPKEGYPNGYPPFYRR